MRFGLGIPPCASPQDVAATVARAEAQGFDYAWIPDSQLLWRDVGVTLACGGSARLPHRPRGERHQPPDA